ncbi:exported protein (hyp2) [Plasmodium gaboni]|uniref:Exported protein (Hyp2) n=1 Tax=Plasmodium gaboni TaxID=647221 RepID=A0A151LWS3_9APIC|nr:exported protein (hyp2) [Plasmodium gaboni]KYO03634.1 exported protein (hyp2) [Plasmodium gaboni]
MIHAYVKIFYIAVLFGLIVLHQNVFAQKQPYEEKNEDNKLKTRTLSYLRENKEDEPNKIEPNKIEPNKIEPNKIEPNKIEQPNIIQDENQTNTQLRNQQIQINNTIDEIIQNSDGDEKLQRLNSTSWLINNMEAPEEVKQRLRGLAQSYIYNEDDTQKRRIIKEIYNYSVKEENDDIRKMFLKILKCRNLNNTEPQEYHLPLEGTWHLCCLFA